MIIETDRQTGATTRYTYDVENQLIRINFPDGKFAEYRYDGLGRRFEKNVNGQITRYVYDNEDIHLEYDGANQLKAAYVHGIGIDEPLIMYRGGKSYYYHADGLGSVVQLTDAQGNVVKSYIYNSFGVMVKQTGTVENPYTYTGREFDPESGLYYYRTRYYDSFKGRFTQEDPIPFRAGLNLYIYVGNYPIGRIDPFGLDWLDWLVATSNFFAGAGDALTFGGTRWVREKMGTDDVVDKCSGFYVAGGWTGTGLQFATGAAATTKVAGVLKLTVNYFRAEKVYAGVRIVSPFLGGVKVALHTAHHNKPTHLVLEVLSAVVTKSGRLTEILRRKAEVLFYPF